MSRTMLPRFDYLRPIENGGEQVVAVLREGRGIPDAIAETDEPPERQVKVEPPDQEPFRADRVEQLQQHGPEQLLRHDRGKADPDWCPAGWKGPTVRVGFGEARFSVGRCDLPNTAQGAVTTGVFT